MAKETTSSLTDMIARVKATHARMTAGNNTPAQPAAPPSEKKKPERPAVAEKVATYFQQKYHHDPHKEQLCDALFGCKVWPTEELLLEDLVRAKHAGNAKEVSQLRDLIHANSWSSHKATPSHDALIKKASQLCEALEAERSSLARANPDDATNFDERIHEGTVILDALRTHIDSERAEAAALAIEHWMDDAWRHFQAIRKSVPFDWKEEKKLRGTRPQLRAIMERIEALRVIRDQLYFQRLYPVLFREGKEPPHQAA